MQDDLQKAYAAYQQALYLLPNPKVRDNNKWHRAFRASVAQGFAITLIG